MHELFADLPASRSGSRPWTPGFGSPWRGTW